MIDLLQHIRDNRFSIILNSRETDIIDIYVKWIKKQVESEPSKKILVLSASNDTNNMIRFKLIHSVEHGFITKSSVKSLTFANNNVVYFYTLHKNTMYRQCDHYIMIDCDYMRSGVFENIFKNIIQMLSENSESKLIISSTPNKFGYFMKLFNAAETDNNSFKSFRYYYWMCNNVNNEWIKHRIKMLGKKWFSLEYDLTFG